MNKLLLAILRWLLAQVDVAVEIVDGKLHVQLRVGEIQLVDLWFPIPSPGEKKSAKAL